MRSGDLGFLFLGRGGGQRFGLQVGIGAGHGDQFVEMRFGFGQLADQVLLLFDERVELGNFFGVLALLMFAEEEEIRVVLGAPAMVKNFTAKLYS